MCFFNETQVERAKARVKKEKNAGEVNRASEMGSFGPISASSCLNRRATVSHHHIKQGSELDAEELDRVH